MLVLYALAGLLVLTLLYLLMAPFYLEINSATGLFRLRFQKLIRADIRISESSLVLDLKMAWWHRQFDVLSKSASGKRPAKQMKNKGASKRTKRSIPLHKGLAVLQSFKINKLDISICFDDMAWNGLLYPLFFWLSRLSRKNMEINFQDRNEVILEIENSCFRMIRAYLIA